MPRADSPWLPPPRSCPKRSFLVQSFEEAPDCFDRTVDLLVAVRERDEERLELGRRDVDPARQEVAEERRVALGVACGGVLEPPDRLRTAEERQHRTDALDAAEGRESFLQPRPAPLELLVDRRIAKPPQ